MTRSRKEQVHPFSIPSDSPLFRLDGSRIPAEKPGDLSRDQSHAAQVSEKGMAPAEGKIARLPSPNCVVSVDGGRGFIIEHRVKVPKLPQLKGLRTRKFTKRRLIVTAGHCLPYLPPPHRASKDSERTFEKLLSSLDGSKKDIWTECLFVDPVADIAVLGCPDEQELYDEADAFHALTEDASVLRIGNARSGQGWVLSLDCEWVRTSVELRSGKWDASLTIDPTESGMSGSPILDNAGRAIGIVAVGFTMETADKEGLQPILTRSLPGWLLQDLNIARRTGH